MKLFSNTKDLSLSVVIYIVSNVIGGIVPFLFLKVLTDYLSPTEYGILNIYDLIIFLLLPFVSLNANTSLNRYYFDDDINYSKLIFNSFVLNFVTSLLILAILFLLHKFFIDYFSFEFLWIFALATYLFFYKNSEFLLVSFQVQQKSMKFAIFRILKSILEVAVVFCFIYYFDNKLNAKVYGQTFAYLIIFIFVVYYFRKQGIFHFSIDKEYMRKIIRYSIPLIPHALGAFAINLSDRVVIKYYLGNYDVGIYAVGYQIGMIISMLQTAFNQAWVPWFFGNLKKNSQAINIKIMKITYVYAVLLAIIAIGLIIAAPLIFKLLINGNYDEALKIVPYVAVGYVFNGLYKMMVNYLFYHKKTRIIGIFTVVIASLNIILNIILIPKIGAVGAAIATTLSFFLQFLFFTIFVIKNYNLPWLLNK